MAHASRRAGLLVAGPQRAGLDASYDGPPKGRFSFPDFQPRAATGAHAYQTSKDARMLTTSVLAQYDGGYR
jgi:hypothetical protein